MKNERCLIKKSVEKVVKIWMIFIGCTFLMGFYSERNIYIDLEDIVIELGDTLDSDQIDYINDYLSSSNYFLEDNVPKNEYGETTKIGTYSYYIVYRNEERKYSKLTNKKATVSVIDTISPKININETTLEFEYGSEINVEDIATCIDSSMCTLKFNNEIDTTKSGVHEVSLLAIDEGNNITNKTVNITIKEKPRIVYNDYSYYSASLKEMDDYNNSINNGLSEEEKNERRYALIEFAKQFVGNPYVYGGTSLTNGTDCSGFTMSVYNNFGYMLPRTSNSQSYIGIRVNENELLPGDIITYITNGVGSHVGIYIGNGMMIHAGTPQTGIVIIPMYSGYRIYNRIIY